MLLLQLTDIFDLAKQGRKIIYMKWQVFIFSENNTEFSTTSATIWLEEYGLITQNTCLSADYNLSQNLNNWTNVNVQSGLVISNSLISNYRLSRSKNLVPVLTWNYDNR